MNEADEQKPATVEWTEVRAAKAKAAIQVLALGVEMFVRAAPSDLTTFDHAWMAMIQASSADRLDEAIERMQAGLANFIDGVIELEEGEEGEDV